MEIGIIGLPQTGKTTLFNALTGADVDLGAGRARKEVNMAVAHVHDDRLDELTAIFQPRKKVETTINYADVSGLDQGRAREGGYPKEFLSHIKGTDALVYVARSFESDEVPAPGGQVDPLRDLQQAMDEFLFSDLEIVTQRLERIASQYMKTKQPELKREQELLEHCRDALEDEIPLRRVSFTPPEDKVLRSFSFLTRKPILVVINLGEEQLGSEDALLETIRTQMPEDLLVIGLCAQVEAEIARLSAEDAADFLADYGIKQPARDRIIRASYDRLGLVSFFTVGDDECRAWPIPVGTHAVQAAGVIHSDLERGFIAAEVVGYDRFMEAGSLAECKHRGTLRLEGRDYPVVDGDIISIRFNV